MEKPIPIRRDQRTARQRTQLEREGVPYRLLVDSIRDYAIFMLDPQGNIVSWNPGAERLKGYTEEEAVGHHFSMFYPRRDIAAGKPARLLEEARSFGRVEDEGWRVRKDGSQFWANVTITALRGRDDVLVGFVKITRDLTIRREAERHLKESEERFRLLVEAVKDYAIFMLDPAGRIISWNSGAQTIKGYTADEVIGKHFSIFYTPEDIASGKPERELRTALEVGRVEDVGWRVRKDGTVFYADVLITAVWDENGALRGYAKVTRDITGLRKAEEERVALLEARIRADETNRAKDEFLMTLSHELRTPMTSIMGWARMLADGTLSPEETRTAIDSIVESSRAQATIINDVLDVSRLMTGKLRLNIGGVDPEKLAYELMTALMPAAKARRVSLIGDVEPGIGSVPADTDRLRQIVWNLLSNAIKFSPKGGSVFLRIHRIGSNLEIMVEDEGAGVPVPILPTIFQPFVQADSSSTRRHGGLGLGLTIVRNLTELHGGTVTVENLPKGGASFRVVLPIGALHIRDEREQLPRQQTQALAKTESVRLDGAKILFVDDHPQSRQVVQSILSHAGAAVEAVGSVAEALGIAESMQPDLIITDIAMPDADGYDLARALRERQRKSELRRVPILAFTAFGSPGTQRSTANELFDGWLKKPLDPVDLIAAIAEKIGRRSG